jgi:hypothetical protein
MTQAQLPVRWVPCRICIYTGSQWPLSQALASFRSRENPSIQYSRKNTQLLPIISFTGLFLFVSGLCFAIDRSSRVCIHPTTAISPGQDLTEAASIAIWNKNRVAVGMALCIWVINVGFLIEGRSLLFSSVTGHMEL